MAFYSSRTSLLFLNLMFTFVVIPPYTQSLSFGIPAFDPNMTNVVYEGDAVPLNGEIQLNRVDYLNRVARATYGEHVRVWDPATQTLTDFTTKFSFIIDTLNNSGGYGHGIVFFLAPVDSEIPPNSAGGFLGLYNTTTLLSPSKSNILGVEFDSHSNQEWDPPGEHVGFIINSLSSVEYVSWNASMHSLDVAIALVSYKASTKTLNLLLTYNDSPMSYNVSFHVDLRKILPEWVKIGFSAATGRFTEMHRVLSWEFNSTLEGKDVTTTRNAHGHRKLILGLVIPLGAMVGAAIVGAAFFIVRVRLKRSERKEEEDRWPSLSSLIDAFNSG